MKRAALLRLGPGRGALWLIALLFAGSAGLRAATEAGPEVLAALAPGSPVPEPTTCEPPPDLAAALARLAERQAAFDAREATLADREATLRIAEAEITRNLAALQAAEERLSALLAIADEAAETDLERLTDVYESMKPKEAAAVFAAMDTDFAAGFLGRMRPDAAAAVLAGLPPETAYSISVILAARNASAPSDRSGETRP